VTIVTPPIHQHHNNLSPFLNGNSNCRSSGSLIVAHQLGFLPQEKNFWIIMIMFMVFDMLFIGNITERFKKRKHKEELMQAQEPVKDIVGKR